MLCGKRTKPVPEKEQVMKASDSKKIKRFPRELPKLTKEQDYTLHMIEEKCMDFMCPGRVIDVKCGPMITEYKFQPDKFTRLKRLKTLNEDLAIAIPAEQVSVVRVPGESCVGISVPNKERRIVKFDECLKNVLAHRHDMELPINFGITSAGRTESLRQRRTGLLVPSEVPSRQRASHISKERRKTPMARSVIVSYELALVMMRALGREKAMSLLEQIRSEVKGNSSFSKTIKRVLKCFRKKISAKKPAASRAKTTSKKASVMPIKTVARSKTAS